MAGREWPDHRLSVKTDEPFVHPEILWKQRMNQDQFTSSEILEL